MRIDYVLKKYGDSMKKIMNIQVQIQDILKIINNYDEVSDKIVRKRLDKLGIQKQRRINRVVENEVIRREKVIKELEKEMQELIILKTEVEDKVWIIDKVINELPEADRYLIKRRYIHKDSIREIVLSYNQRYIRPTKNFNENSCRFYFHKLRLEIQQNYSKMCQMFQN